MIGNESGLIDVFARQDGLVVGIAGLVGAGHADCGPIAVRALVFAHPTAGTAVGIHVRLLDRLRLAIAVLDLDFDEIDCLIGNRAVLLADHAVPPVCVGDAAGDVEAGRFGFDPGCVLPDRLGLGIMRERAQAIGATLTIESEPGHGTRVTVVWEEDK